MARPTRQYADERILDRAAGLFARHGFAHTSLKDLADAVGLSKAGLLHHFPSKEALFQAAREMGRVHSQQVLDRVAGLPAGAARDRRAVELLVDVALDRPGLVALASRAISALGTDEEPDDDSGLEGIDRLVFSLFGVDPEGGDTERLVRVVGMLSALAVLSLSANRAGDRTGWRPHIITTCLDALGHGGPGATPPAAPAPTRSAPSDPAQVED
ncbi:TetR/AcrR family transcriptional regulator [Saccharothrix syringae]|uniref:TetR/AcrR family transcriptional regulator n=1 Tax=Saccharothrix syringae TaxID=103733 RepID=A0A5Q0H456_SACSY|nr:TetR/AcrR family transcriptional regulator [Saccharothrix syringae]QFZ20833.1 TetR/AcrR family transcriptional regulator [Saccharothrix syringae]